MNNQFFFDLLYKVKNSRFNKFQNRSYSQEGEDLILSKFFDGKRKGFFVDVGAFHPVRFSNTLKFYKLGWHGINIEARPGSKKLFDSIRKRDINVEYPVSDVASELVYYCFNEPALNGFSPQLTMERNGIGHYKVIKEIKMMTKRLDEILDEYLPIDQKIDFMSIDVESFDLNVLKSNNWNKYKPEVILVEDLEFDFNNSSSITSYLGSNGYQMFARTFNTSLFKLIS